MGLARFHVAEYNFGLARAPFDSAEMAEFVAQLTSVNEIAERSPGFVWREQTNNGNAIITRSVWESVDDLSAFVYRSGHLEVLRRRREWFEPVHPHMVLWWTPIGGVPSVAEAEDRLAHLREHGPSPRAFTFKQRFVPGDSLALRPTSVSGASTQERRNQAADRFPFSMH